MLTKNFSCVRLVVLQGESVKKINLTQGYVALVDDADFEKLNAFSWQVLKTKSDVYARSDVNINGKKTTLLMHRLILNLTDPNLVVDHIDHNTLNNQKSNLRKCTQSENLLNRRISKNSSSGMTGVNYVYRRIGDKIKKYIKAVINFRGHRYYLGMFKTELDAAKAYNLARNKILKKYTDCLRKSPENIPELLFSGSDVPR